MAYCFLALFIKTYDYKIRYVIRFYKATDCIFSKT